MVAIIKYDDGREETIEISEGKRQQLYRESLSFLNQSILLHWKAEMVRAFSLTNIHINRLHDADNLTWKEFLASVAISERTAQRLLRIGERIREVIKIHTKASLLPKYITQRDFSTSFEPFFANGKQATLKQLDAAAKDLETFNSYLAGDKSLEDKDAIKLLNAKNRKTAEQREREEREEKIKGEIKSGAEYLYRTEAASRGYIASDDEIGYKNQDGSELTEKQLAEFMSAVDAMRMLREMERALIEAKDMIERAVKSHAPAFNRYREHANDNAFHIKSKEIFRTARNMVTQIDEQLVLAFADTN